MTAQRVQPLFSELPATEQRRLTFFRQPANLLAPLSHGSRVSGPWRAIRLSPAFIGYLVLPRPGPLLSAGKLSFLLLGSFVAITSGAQVPAPLHWLLVVTLYELFVSQGKYLLNDVCGRMSDAYFLRGTRNQCPRSGIELALLIGFAILRAGFGVGALFLCAGWTAAAAGALTLLLQVLY
jgi:hypothetical protein